MLQAEERNLRPEVTRGSLSHLLKARSLREARDEDVAAWRVQANFACGSGRLLADRRKRLQGLPAPQGARLLQISDPLDPESQFLHIRIMQTSSASRQPQSGRPTLHIQDSPSPRFFGRRGWGLRVTYDCPCLPAIFAPACCASRFIRNRVAEMRKVKMAESRSPIWFISAKTASSPAPPRIRSSCFFRPDTPTGNLAKPKLYSSPLPGNALAVGKVGKGVALMTTTEEADQLRIVRVGAQNGKALTGTFAWPFPQISPMDAHDALATAYYKQDATGMGCWNMTLNHVQIQVSAGSEPDTLTARVVTPNRAFAPVLHGNFLVGPEMTGIRMGLQAQPAYVPGISGGDKGTSIYGEFPTAQTAHYGFGGPLSHPVYGLWALEITPGEWKILHQDENGKEAQTDVFLQQGGSVVGVVAVPGIEASGCGPSQYASALVVLDITGRILGLQGKGWQRWEPPAAAPIAQITASPFEPNVAYVTQHGEVVVYSLTRRTALYRLDTE